MAAAEECSRSRLTKKAMRHVRLRLDRETILIKGIKSYARLKLS
jgi:hypothetical protein